MTKITDYIRSELLEWLLLKKESVGYSLVVRNHQIHKATKTLLAAMAK